MRNEVRHILDEDAIRKKQLEADYDPITGKDGPLHRVELKIPDYPIPVQYVPDDMLKNTLIKSILKAGSINAFISKNPQYSREGVIKRIRKIRHRHDFACWAYFQVHIVDKEGKGVIRYKLNYAQFKVLEVCEELRKAGLPINLVICKARQWGGSTFCIFYQSWLALMWRESHSFSVCAQTNGVAASIVTMLSDAFKMYNPFDLDLPNNSRLSLVSSAKGNEYVIKDGNNNNVRHNKIRIGSIIAPDNLRGLPGSGAHFSEVGVWPDTPSQRPEDLIKSIAGGILPRPYTMQVIESTPKGKGNFFERAYLRAKRGESNFRAVFIPWYYIKFDTLPIADKEAFATWLWEHREDNEPMPGYKDAGKWYWYLWTLGATLEGIQWYMIKSMEFDDHADMASEAPSDDIEAFQFSGSKVFSIYDIKQFEADCKPISKRGMLYADEEVGKKALTNVRFVESPNGDVQIWDMPDDTAKISNRYLVCVDIGGRTKTADWSVARVIDRFAMMFGGKPEIVAQMRYHTDHDILAYDVARLAKFYNNALLVIESNTLETHNANTDSGMSEYVLNIVASIYDNLYARSVASEEDIQQGKYTKWGFHTNTSTKPKIIGNLQTCVREQLWVERDSYMLDELALYEKDSKGAYNAAKGEGNHDDMLMATAIGLWICFNEMPAPAFKKEEPSRTRKSHHNGSTNYGTI